MHVCIFGCCVYTIVDIRNIICIERTSSVYVYTDLSCIYFFYLYTFPIFSTKTHKFILFTIIIFSSLFLSTLLFIRNSWVHSICIYFILGFSSHHRYYIHIFLACMKHQHSSKSQNYTKKLCSENCHSPSFLLRCSTPTSFPCSRPHYTVSLVQRCPHITTCYSSCSVLLCVAWLTIAIRLLFPGYG